MCVCVYIHAHTYTFTTKEGEMLLWKHPRCYEWVHWGVVAHSYGGKELSPRVSTTVPQGQRFCVLVIWVRSRPSCGWFASEYELVCFQALGPSPQIRGNKKWFLLIPFNKCPHAYLITNIYMHIHRYKCTCRCYIYKCTFVHTCACSLSLHTFQMCLLSW